jgi:predicted dehydrogenase
MPDGKVCLGLIGAGRWGANYVPTIADLPAIELSWIADPDPSVTRRLAYSCPVYSHWKQAFEVLGADGIIIATPPGTHAEIAKAAIDLEIPALIEKPLTLSHPEATTLLLKAKKKSVHVSVGHVHLFSSAYRRLKEVARSCGPIRRIVSQGGGWGPFRTDVPALWDWGPHDIALALDLLGMPNEIECDRRQCKRTPEGQGEIIGIDMAFPCGATAEIEIGNLFDSKKRWLRVEFDAGSLFLDDTKDRKLISEGLGVLDWGDKNTMPVSKTPPLANSVISFVETIRTGSTDLSQLQLGVDVVQVLTQCDNKLSQ